jgi:hypothetical protein
MSIRTQFFSNLIYEAELVTFCVVITKKRLLIKNYTFLLTRPEYLKEFN